MRRLVDVLAVAMLLLGPLASGAAAQTAAPAEPPRAAALLERAQAAMIVDPKEVISLAGEARRALDAQPQTTEAALARTRALWLESEALGRLGELDRAERTSAEALVAAERLQRGGKLHGDILMTRGAIALDKNEMQRAFRLFRGAHAIFQRIGDTRAQAIALQNIGTIYSYAGDQRSVLRYYAQAAEVHPGDAALTQAAANNRGFAYKELNKLERADAEFQRALALARQVGSTVLEVRVLNNLASVALLRGQLAEAARHADRGLKLARATGDTEWTPFLWGVKAQIALRTDNIAQAVRLFDRTFGDADLDKTSFYFRDFHQSASEAYRRAGQADLAFRHLQAFKRLDDEAREIRSSTNAALSAAQFDFSNQELRIVKLRQAELQTRSRQQMLVLAGSLLLLAVTLAAFFWVRRSRNHTRAANRQLETSNTALDKALRAKSEFLATTSHEIRTPLNGILGMTQVLLGRRGLEAGVRDQVELIDSAGNTMKAIVDDILDMAQIEQGRVQIDRTDIALPKLVESIAGLWRAAAERKGVALEVDLDGAPAMIHEDERKLRQISFNLLSNAIKFTQQGSVRLTVSTTDADGAERLVIAVQDSGIGIAADQLGPIFEPFRQADGGTTRQFGGTGLGLAISSKLAEALGGRIAATSEVGVGSCFTVTLPLVRVDAPVATEDGGARATGLKDATVLLVEANPLFASMTEACLGDEVGAVIVCDDLTDIPARVDVVLLGEDATTADIALLRRTAPAALLVMVGESDVIAALVDGVVARQMPPLHLAPALEALLTEVRQPDAAAA